MASTSVCDDRDLGNVQLQRCLETKAATPAGTQEEVDEDEEVSVDVSVDSDTNGRLSASAVVLFNDAVKADCTVRLVGSRIQTGVACMFAGVNSSRNADWTRVRPAETASTNSSMLHQSWLTTVSRNRHSSSGGTSYGGAGGQQDKQQTRKVRGGSASVLSEAVALLTNSQNKRWSVAGAGPELTLMRVKLDDVQRELCELQSKHEVMTMEYQDVLNDLDCCRQGKARLDQELHDIKLEAMRWQNDYDMLVKQKQFSDDQIIDLQLRLQTKQSELDQLRCLYQDVIDGRPGQSSSKSTMVEEYNELCQEANGLKERCRLLETELVELRGCFRLAQEEFHHSRMSCEEEMDGQKRKICSLEERQVALYQQLHKMAQDRDILRSENELLKQQVQDLCSDVTRNLNGRQKLQEDVHLLRRKHDGVLSEYHHIMSERDSVLKENERLAEERSVLLKKLKTTESDRQAMVEQLKTMETKLEIVHRERQELKHRLNKVRENDGDDEVDFARHHAHRMADVSNSSIGRGSLEALPVANTGRHEEMRRLVDSLREELVSIRQDVQGAQQQRDWALAERQRVVSERDEMRAISETLRTERDEAVTNLAVAIRDADTLRRQREQAERDVRRYREMLEKGTGGGGGGDSSALTTGGGSNVDSTPSNSHDSAIDADMAEWEIDTLQFNMNGCQKSEELGVILRGGRDDPISGHVVPIYVKSVVAGSRLDGLLRPYDCIMQVNNIDVSLMDRRSVMDILRNSNSVKMAIRRRRLVGMKLISVPLATGSDGDVGVVFEDGVYVSKLKTSSAAAKAGSLAVGDRLIYVNDIPVQNRSADSVAQLIRGFKDNGLVLAVMKSPPMLSPMTPNGGCSCCTTPSSSSGRFEPAANVDLGQIRRRDISVQTSGYDAPKKNHQWLFEKMHDKFFGRADRKTTAVRSSDVAAAAAAADASSKRCRPGTATYPHRPRPTSVYGNYTVVDRTISSAAEQKVLQNLDSILEANEKEDVGGGNRALDMVKSMDRRSSAGGTWPKYKPAAVDQSPQMAPSDANGRRKQSSTRRALLPLFMPDKPGNGKCEAKMRNSVVSPLTSPRQQTTACSSRPVSYHPSSSVFNSSSNSGGHDQWSARFLTRRPMSPLASSCGRSDDVDMAAPGNIQLLKQQLQVAHAMPVMATAANGRQHFFGPTAVCIDQELDGRSVTSQSSDSRTAPFMNIDQCSSTKSLYNRSGHNDPLLSFSSSEDYGSSRLCKGDVRTLYIEKRSSHEGLGISIASSGTGVFVSSVSENSLAARHGLQVGDQLLEVCGINMRSANIQHASNVLSHLGRSEQITLMVQYNPSKYSREMTVDQRSGCSTPKAQLATHQKAAAAAFFSQDSSSLSQHSHELLLQQHGYAGGYFAEPRFVFVKRDGDEWPFSLAGGNAVGIFIDEVVSSSDQSLEGVGGLRVGDQLLEFDGVSLRKLTLEQAVYELAVRPVGAEVSMLVQHNEAKYRQSKLGASDSFYVRATVDRLAENTDELNFKAGDILRVDNTVFNGVLGLWRAWLVDQEGRERSCGIIPSKTRLEEELLFRRSGSEISTLEAGGDSGPGSRKGTIRRSLKFIRRSSRSAGSHQQQQHQRTPSKESRDLESADSAAAAAVDDLYQRVERIDYKQKRPVLILGALVDVIVLKLLEEYPKLFVQCVPECVKPMPVTALEQGIQQNVYVDYRRRDKLFEITRVAAVKDLIDKGYHCVLHVSPAAVERLHRMQIYPVVIYVKLKSAKQIKELCDDRLTSKQAKDMFDVAAKLEADHHNLLSAVISGPHHSLKQICQQIACTVEHEQKKTLWIISGESM